MPTFIPTNNEKRIVWLNNFKTGFANVAAQNGFTVEEVVKVAEACETLIFSVKLARTAKIYSKVCIAYRNMNFKFHRRTVEQVPEFKMPEIPPKLAPTDALGYLQEIAQRMKVQSNYTKATGSLLGIAPPKAKELSREEAKPKGKTIALANSVVRINWVKRNFVGVIVQSKRGDESDWKEIGRDMVSPYIDTRPPLIAGLPEQRFYSLIYIVDDQPFGNYSDILQAVTNP